MRVLLDTNIIIHREARRVVRNDIGLLFAWLDRLKYEKCIHPLTIDEVKKHKDPSVVATFEIKLQSYQMLKTISPELPEIVALRLRYDKNDNDHIDSSLLKEVFTGRIDALITEDRKTHLKAIALGIDERVFTIDSFLEKVNAENPQLATYKVLSVRQEYFGNIDLSDSFFDLFKSTYKGFETWFNRKADEIAYICNSEDGRILAFLYVKVEDVNENYSDIEPAFMPKRRLKIGTLKVESNGYKLGERFLKIAFDNAIKFQVDEIYLTVFNHDGEQDRLINFLQDWGFKLHGKKRSSSGEELVYTRDFTPRVDVHHPSLTYPYLPRHTKKFIVPIYPSYHTELFPDSILNTESPKDYVENKPNRNAISKVYISRSLEKGLSPGDLIIFYRTSDGGPAHYTSVATTVGITQSIHTNVASLEQFIGLCRKRSVFNDQELTEYWNYSVSNRPFVVNFLYAYSFPKRLNLKSLKGMGIIEDAPRGFTPLSDEAYQKLMENSNADKRLIID